MNNVLLFLFGCTIKDEEGRCFSDSLAEFSVLQHGLK